MQKRTLNNLMDDSIDEEREIDEMSNDSPYEDEGKDDWIKYCEQQAQMA